MAIVKFRVCSAWCMEQLHSTLFWKVHPQSLRCLVCHKPCKLHGRPARDHLQTPQWILGFPGPHLWEPLALWALNTERDMHNKLCFLLQKEAVDLSAHNNMIHIEKAHLFVLRVIACMCEFIIFVYIYCILCDVCTTWLCWGPLISAF